MSSKLVYSTGGDNQCPRCGKRLDKCRCEQIDHRQPKGDGIVRIGRETKGRGGKQVTLIRGIELPEAELKALAKKLKARCGSGGSVKQGVIELQGDKRQVALEFLEAENFTVKLAGG